MKNEMELMNMDERQRLAWFMANRGTVIAVGAVWIGMIGWELAHGRVPAFLMAMVPVFALLRAGLYVYYGSRSFAQTDSDHDPRVVRYSKAAAAILLVLAALLPVYSVEGGAGHEASAGYVWQLVRDDFLALPVLAVVYLWPVGILGLTHLCSRRLFQVMVQFLEPVLVVASAVVVLWIPQVIFETHTLFSVLIVPTNPNPALGCYLAVGANGLYLLSWFVGFLRPWGIQTS